MTPTDMDALTRAEPVCPPCCESVTNEPNPLLAALIKRPIRDPALIMRTYRFLVAVGTSGILETKEGEREFRHRLKQTRQKRETS